MSSYTPAVAVPTLIGSLLSCVASCSILVCYIILPQKRHFRHILIINLALADFVNSLNNSISGIILFTHGGLTSGPACTFNGWLGQFTVQGTDFSILFIAIVTVAAFHKSIRIPEANIRNKIFVTLAVWFVPLITSTTGLALNDYAPVSGNWCWLSGSRPGLRYALGHGWRFAIILISICLYVLLYTRLRREFLRLHNYETGLSSNGNGTRSQQKSIQDQKSIAASESELPLSPLPPKEAGEFPIQHISEGSPFPRPGDSIKNEIQTHEFEARTEITPSGSAWSAAGHVTSNPTRRKQSDIQKLLLMNAYPIAYIILWLPGLLNRILELLGHSYLWLKILQSSTQYIGLANAITYGWTEGVRKDLMALWRGNKRI